ncbi:MAG: phosphohistidine phosphatase SixA [Snowella sp.]|nr:phosphohistidine phosphatase SixA [Snowella sp.]
MDIYLIRHGIAADKEDYANDRDRPLIPKGEEKTQRVAQRLKAMGIEFELMLTSPFVRAKQTAQILFNVGLAASLEDYEPLSHGGDLRDFLQDWETSRYVQLKGALALVGHEPDLSQWAEQLLWGNIQEKMILKKSGIIGLSVPTVGSPLGKSQLFLLISPKWFV